MRIAMLSLHASPVSALGTRDTGGMSVYIREIACEIGKSGIGVDIFTSSQGMTDEREIQLSEKVRLIHLYSGKNRRIPKNRLYRYTPDLFQQLDTYRKKNCLRYDLVHSHYWLSGLVGSRACSCWKVPHFITFHTTGLAKKKYCPEENEPANRLIAEEELVRNSARVIVSSQAEKNSMSEHFDVRAENIVLIPCGVNADRFRPVQKDLARKQAGIAFSVPFLLYVGRFTPVKGIERLISAAAYLRHCQGLRLMIVGGDGHLSSSSRELKRLTRTLHIDKNVIFKGRVDHDILPSYYSAADVLVVPSYYESFGLVALEALACGTPVVASRVGAMESLIINNKTGAIVDDLTPGTLAGVIEKFISPQQDGHLSPEEIRASVLDHSWANAAATMIEEYRRAIEDMANEHKKEQLLFR